MLRDSIGDIYIGQSSNGEGLTLYCDKKPLGIGNHDDIRVVSIETNSYFELTDYFEGEKYLSYLNAEGNTVPESEISSLKQQLNASTRHVQAADVVTNVVEPYNYSPLDECPSVDSIGQVHFGFHRFCSGENKTSQNQCA